MLFRHLLWVAVIAAAFNSSPFASAQFYGGGCSTCGTAAAPAPVVTSCAPVQPVYSACYQTVPVTTYRKEKQTVRVPYYKTSYEDRKVTTYEPVTRTRTVTVPTVSYKTVYENRTVHRDRGRWQTNYQPIAKCAPCQVDPRPGLIGWLNRTGYSFRSAFVPNYRTSRQYVPNMVACNVQIPRQVAVRGTREVAQQYTEMVARTKTERVAVRKVAWRDEEVTVNRPVTAYQTVPIGSTLAYGGSSFAYGGSSFAYGGFGYPGSSIAFIEDEDSSRTARRPEPDPAFDDGLKSADETFREDAPKRSSDRSFDRNDDGRFQRSSHQRELPPAGSELKQPPRAFPAEGVPTPDFGSNDRPSQYQRSRVNQRSHVKAESNARRTAPAVAGGWRSTRRSAVRTAGTDSPRGSEISLTDRN